MNIIKKLADKTIFRKKRLAEARERDRLILSYQKRRKSMLLDGIDKIMSGLEIGPSLRPVAPKREGYNVETVDHMDKAGLVAKYTSLGLSSEAIDSIEDVDHIWSGSSYVKTTGKPHGYDYIIASHCIEHTTDFAGFIIDCSRLLKNTEDAVLSLAIPDKRYTLDHFRTVSCIERVVNDYLRSEKSGSMGALMDFYLHCTRRGNETSWIREWEDVLPKDYQFVHEQTFANEIYKSQKEHFHFEDIHQYVFTPASFTLLIKELLSLHIIDMDIYKTFPAEQEEFIVQLKKVDLTSYKPLTDDERMALLRQVSIENVIS